MISTKTEQKTIPMNEIKEGYLYEIVSAHCTGSIVMKPVAVTYVIEVYSPRGEGN